MADWGLNTCDNSENLMNDVPNGKKNWGDILNERAEKGRGKPVFLISKDWTLRLLVIAFLTLVSSCLHVFVLLEIYVDCCKSHS